MRHSYQTVIKTFTGGLGYLVRIAFPILTVIWITDHPKGRFLEFQTAAHRTLCVTVGRGLFRSFIENMNDNPEYRSHRK